MDLVWAGGGIPTFQERSQTGPNQGILFVIILLVWGMEKKKGTQSCQGTLVAHVHVGRTTSVSN